MPIWKLIKRKIWRPEYYYYINRKGTISKKKWTDSKLDLENEKNDNFFLDYEDAYKKLNK